MAQIYEALALTLDLDCNEVFDVLADVLLYDVTAIDASGNFTVHRVPRSPDLGAEITPQWTQILIEVRSTVTGPHPEMHRPISVVAKAGRSQRIALTTSRALNDDFVHVVAHKAFSEKQKALGRTSTEGSRHPA